MRSTVLLAAAFAAAAIMVGGTGVTAGAPIDQEAPAGNGVSGFCDASLGQGFIANRTGRLTQLDVLVNRSPIGDPGDLRFDLRTVDLDEGLPTSTVLASGTIPRDSITLGPGIGWSTVLFDPAPRVRAGSWYAITTATPDCVPPADSGFGWSVELDTDSYPRGRALYSADQDGPWIDEPMDHAFRTYVQRAPVIDQPDLAIRRGASGPWTGTDLYDIDGWTERVEASVTPGTTVVHQLRITNDGDRRDSYTVKSDGANARFAVRYLKGKTGTTSITKAVVAGTYRIGPLEPGESRVIRVRITVKAWVAPGASRSLAPVVRSVSRPAFSDAGRIRLTVE
jgi:hypothetical protein